jgi:uncharacterized protein YodC (DUF2158 family)
MPQFKQGNAVRTKGGRGPNMTVDGYTTSGEVICTYWLKGKRQQEHFVEATLAPVPPPQPPIQPEAATLLIFNRGQRPCRYSSKAMPSARKAVARS